MKKNALKSILCFFAVVLLLFPMSVAAQASEIPVVSSHIHSDDVALRDGPEVCSGLPYHDMKASGWGTAWEGSNVFSTMLLDGYSWRCRNCGLYMVTQGESIPFGANIGYYSTSGYWGEVSGYINLFNAQLYGPINSPDLPGYKFSYNVKRNLLDGIQQPQ